MKSRKRRHIRKRRKIRTWLTEGKYDKRVNDDTTGKDEDDDMYDNEDNEDNEETEDKGAKEGR